MFKTMLDTQMIFYLMGVIGGIGILSKLVSEGTLRSLVKAAENMSKSSHRFMKLVRAKFEHACMVSLQDLSYQSPIPKPSLRQQQTLLFFFLENGIFFSLSLLSSFPRPLST